MIEHNKSPELIGIAGTFASGKDTVAHYLEKEYGYTHVSTGDMVRETAMRERGSIERPVLFETAQAHRREFGAGAFVQKALDSPRPLVITGIRSLGEANVIKQNGGVLIFVNAPLEIRYERMKARHRDNETELTLEEFSANEQKEWHSGESTADFNLRDIAELADFVIDNGHSMEDFLDEVRDKLVLAQSDGHLKQ